MSNASPKNNLPERVSSWLDVDIDTNLSVPECCEPECSELEFSATEAQQIADLQLIDALLVTSAAAEAEDQERRIKRVIQTLFYPEQEQSRLSVKQAASRTKASRQSLWAVAACLLVSCSLFWAWALQQSHAVAGLLHEISVTSLETENLVYEVLSRDPAANGKFRSLGKMYHKGREAFVLVSDEVVLGRNQEEFWLVAPDCGVVVADSFDWIVGSTEHQRHELVILKEISVSSQEFSLVELSAVTEILRSEYDLKLQRDQELQGVQTDLIIGKRRNDDSNLPLIIRLWANHDSRIICQSEFQWGPDESVGSLLIMRLIDTAPPAGNWFQRQHHHAADSPVQRLTDKK